MTAIVVYHDAYDNEDEDCIGHIEQKTQASCGRFEPTKLEMGLIQ